MSSGFKIIVKVTGPWAARFEVSPVIKKRDMCGKSRAARRYDIVNKLRLGFCIVNHITIQAYEIIILPRI